MGPKASLGSSITFLEMVVNSRNVATLLNNLNIQNFDKVMKGAMYTMATLYDTRNL